MKILFENYVIYDQGNSFELYKKVERKKKDSNESYSDEEFEGCFSTFEHLCNKIVRLSLSEKDLTLTIKEYVDLYSKTVNDFLNKTKLEKDDKR